MAPLDLAHREPTRQARAGDPRHQAVVGQKAVQGALVRRGLRPEELQADLAARVSTAKDHAQAPLAEAGVDAEGAEGVALGRLGRGGEALRAAVRQPFVHALTCRHHGVAQGLEGLHGRAAGDQGAGERRLGRGRHDLLRLEPEHVPADLVELLELEMLLQFDAQEVGIHVGAELAPKPRGAEARSAAERPRRPSPSGGPARARRRELLEGSGF